MVTIHIRPDGRTNVLVPTTALLNNGNGAQVFSYDDKTQTITLKSVKVESLTGNGMAEISSGIGVDEQIVTAGVHSLKNGQKVRVMTPASKTNIGGLL